MKFKEEHTFEHRKLESERVMKKYPDRLPVICEKSSKTFMREIDKKKYLVPSDLTCGQFIYVVRRRLALPAEKAIYLFVGGIIPKTSDTIMDIYHQKKDLDGFLYITYSDENVFG